MHEAREKSGHSYTYSHSHINRLAALIISRQEKDGSWWDYPLYDYHQPYGTGYCLMALAWCRDVMDAGS